MEPSRLLCPWDSPGKNTVVGVHFLLQGIFPTRGSNPHLLHRRWILYQLSHQGSLRGLLGFLSKGPQPTACNSKISKPLNQEVSLLLMSQRIQPDQSGLGPLSTWRGLVMGRPGPCVIFLKSRPFLISSCILQGVDKGIMHLLWEVFYLFIIHKKTFAVLQNTHTHTHKRLLENRMNRMLSCYVETRFLNVNLR